MTEFRIAKKRHGSTKEVSDIPLLSAKKYCYIPKKNPLKKDLELSDKDYEVLTKYGIIHPIYLRNHMVKREYKQLKLDDHTQMQAIYKLMEKWKLNYDLTQKIVMSKFFAQNSKEKYNQNV